MVLQPVTYFLLGGLVTALTFLMWRYTEGVERKARELSERVAKLEENTAKLEQFRGVRLPFEVANDHIDMRGEIVAAATRIAQADADLRTALNLSDHILGYRNKQK